MPPPAEDPEQSQHQSQSPDAPRPLAEAGEVPGHTDPGPPDRGPDPGPVDPADPHEVIASFEKQLALAREEGDREEELCALKRLGWECTEREQDRRALAFHKQLLALTRDIADRKEQRGAHLSMGIAHLHLDEPAQALPHHLPDGLKAGLRTASIIPSPHPVILETWKLGNLETCHLGNSPAKPYPEGAP